VDLSLHVEDAFGVRLDDTELNAQTFDTIARLAAIIRERKAGG
jgi:acyl carrier protein